MNLLSVTAAIMIACTSCGHGRGGKWEYQYEVINPGTRSEYVSGRLLYKGALLPPELVHVVTPVGEFVFRGQKGWAGGVPFKWLPAIIDQNGTVAAAITEAEVKGLLEKKEKGLRTTSVETLSGASSAAIVAGSLEHPPAEVGSDWLYIVGSGRWINPEKLDQVFKRSDR